MHLFEDELLRTTLNVRVKNVEVKYEGVPSMEDQSEKNHDSPMSFGQKVSAAVKFGSIQPI